MAYSIKADYVDREFWVVEDGTNRIVIGRNNSPDSKNPTFFVSVGDIPENKDTVFNGGNAVGLSDEQMQELFAAYLIVRKEFKNLAN